MKEVLRCLARGGLIGLAMLIVFVLWFILSDCGGANEEILDLEPHFTLSEGRRVMIEARCDTVYWSDARYKNALSAMFGFGKNYGTRGIEYDTTWAVEIIKCWDTCGRPLCDSTWEIK